MNLNIINNSNQCENCEFDVFNGKLVCVKCSSFNTFDEKYNNTTNTTNAIDNNYNKYINDRNNSIIELRKLEKEYHANSITKCRRCFNEGIRYNKEPMKSSHNCWKYS